MRALVVPLAVGLVGCGSCRAEPQPAARLSLARNAVDFDYWEGDRIPPRDVALDIERGAGGIELAPHAEWITSELQARRGRLRVGVRPEAIRSGVHNDTVRVLDVATGLTVATLQVQLRALRRAPPGASHHALVIGIDGLTPAGLRAARTPWIDRIRDHGSSTDEASTQLSAPTLSGPGWATVLTGVEADRHGVFDNESASLSSIDRGHRTFLRWAADEGSKAAMVAQWSGMLELVEEPFATDADLRTGAAVARRAAERLAEPDLRLLLVHFDDPDRAGHDSGFSADNPAYLQAIAQTDVLIGDLVRAVLARPALADEQWLFVVVTDHAGEGRGHGARTPLHRTIPQIFGGPSVPVGGLSDHASHADVAPTVLSFLGVSPQSLADLDGEVAVRPQ